MTDRDKRLPERADKLVRDIRRATRRKFSSEEKIRIVLEGLRGEETIAELCRKEGIAQNLYYRWSKDFLARNGSLAIPHARQVPMKLRGCVSRHVNLKKPWPKLLLRTGCLKKA